MKKSYLIVLLLVAVIIAASYVYAAKGTVKAKASCAAACSDLCSTECASGMGYGFGPKGLASVNPSKTQIKQLQAIHTNFVKSTKSSRSCIQTKMQKLASLWATGTGTESEVKSLINCVEKDRTKICNAAIASTFKAMKVLNNTQKAKLRASVGNGYLHLVSIGTRMGGTAAVKSAKKMPSCGTSCP